MEIQHKTFVRAADSNDPLEYVMSDATVDRFGDVIDQAGWDLRNFNANPIALFAHDSRFIVGKWVNVRVEGGKLRGRLELLGAHVSERLRELHAAVSAGILRAVSVGFKPLAEPELIKDGGFRFTKQELVECSLVSIPANPNALQVARGLNLSPVTKSLIFGEPAGATEGQSTDNQPGKPAASISNRKGATMSLANKIAATEQRVNALRDQLSTLAEAETLDRDAMGNLNVEINDVQKTLDTLKASEAALAASSTPVTGTALVPVTPKSIVFPASSGKPAAPAIITQQSKSVDRPGDFIYKGLAARVVSHLTKQPLDSVIDQRYSGNLEIRTMAHILDRPEGIGIESMLQQRAAAAVATTTTTGWAVELAQVAIADFLDGLRPLSLYPGLRARGGQFTFGRNGSISIPSRSATPTIAGSFVGEGAPIPVRQGAITAITLTPKKMAVISTFTREIANHSTPSIEAIIRQAIQEDTAVSLDSVLLDATAASAVRPAGLRNGVTVTTATSGGGLAALKGDAKNLLGVLVAANSLRAPVWIMNPVQVLSISLIENAGGDLIFRDEVNRGFFLGYPILQSTTVTAAMVILVDAADFFTATGDDPEFTVNDTATLHMEDTTPVAIGTAGTPNVVAAPVRSLFQTDSIAIRMIMPVNWAMRRTGLVAWTQTVTW